MLNTLAAALIPLISACQMVAMAVLWRRYRMPGAGSWLLATTVMVVCTIFQALEEAGWASIPVLAVVNTLFNCASLAELNAARQLVGQTGPSRRQVYVFVSLSLVWAIAAAVQAHRYAWSPDLYGWLRAPGVLIYGLAETAIALSLVRLSRRSGTIGGYLAASGYALLVAAMPLYPISFRYPALRTVGMVNAAIAFVLIGWGLLLLLLERRQAAIVASGETLAREAAMQAARVQAVERQARSQADTLAARRDQAQLGRLSLDLAKELLATVDDLRQVSSRLQGSTPQAEREALRERLETVLGDLSQVAAGVLIAGGPAPRTVGRVDGRKMLELLLSDLVPPTIGVMKAWPGPQVWLAIDETLLSVALHQLIRCQLTADRPVERLSVILTREPDVSVTLQQALSGRGDGEPPTDAIGLKLAQLAIRRLGGSLEIRPGYTGNILVLRLPADVVDRPTPA
jgi:hypothetical protein